MSDVHELPRRKTMSEIMAEDFGQTEEEIGEELFGHLFQAPGAYRAASRSQKMRWVIKGMLPETYLVVMASTSNGGKSCLATAMAVAVASGEPFLGMKTCGGSVLWVAYEESREERDLALSEYPKLPENLYTTHERLYIDCVTGLDPLRYWVQRTRAKLIVIDPLYAATRAQSLADGRTARRVLSELKIICHDERCAAIVLHHVTKDASAGQTRERFADSNQILATASMDLLMDFKELPDGSRRIWLRGRGRGNFANQTWLIDSNGVADYRLAMVGVQQTVEDRAKDEALIGLLRGADPPMTAEELAAAAGLNLGSVRNRLTHLVQSGAVRVVGRTGYRGTTRQYGA